MDFNLWSKYLSIREYKTYTYEANRLEPIVTLTAIESLAFGLHVGIIGAGGKINIHKNGNSLPILQSENVYLVHPTTTVQLDAEDETINGIRYEFQCWSDGNSNRIRTLRVDENNMSIFANFVGYPDVTMMNVQSTVDQICATPTITWTDIPNQNVSYKVQYSLFKKNSSECISFGPIYIPNGVQTFAITNYGVNHEKDETDRMAIPYCC